MRAKTAPVEVADRIAGDVLAMIGELGAEAAQRTLVHADADPFDHFAGDQFEGADLLQGFRIKIARCRGGAFCMVEPFIGGYGFQEPGTISSGVKPSERAAKLRMMR